MANRHGTILDLRRQDDDPRIDLRPSVLRGLQQTKPELPSIVMWDEVGLNCYEELCHHPAYYLRRAEVEILSQHATNIARTIPAHAIILELGCGSLTKTGLLLSALAAQDKPIAYYALDLVTSTLKASLQSLCTAFPADGPVQVSGVLGSYEDCLAWIPSLCDIQVAGDRGCAATATGTPPPSIHFLWMGNTMANMDLEKAASFLISCRQACSDVPCAFIVGVDGCRDEERLMAAYDMSQGPFYAFMRNGLAAVNRLSLGTVFDPDCWQVRGGFDATTRMMRFGHMTEQPVTVQLDGRAITFDEGAWIEQLVSGKWTADDVLKVAESAGFDLSSRWADGTDSYGFYRLDARVTSSPNS